MKKLLLLTDFSEASHYALAFARSFFGDTVADFHLLCVHPLSSDGSYSPLYATETARTACDDQLHDIIHGLQQEATTNWHTFRSSACPGPLLEVVEQSIKLEPYDFVVLGARADGISELFGSSAIALTRQLKANVLVIPVDAPLRPVRRVVLATNFANLKNAKLLGPIKELVTLKGGGLTLLTIDTPDKETIQVEQEIHLRTFLKPIEPAIARLKASDARQGIDAYLADHTVDLLVMIPRYKNWTSPQRTSHQTDSLVYTPPVPLVTLYDDDGDDLPQRANERSTVELAA